jgi:diguanylate cyclase (GGDEF)-like protein
VTRLTPGAAAGVNLVVIPVDDPRGGSVLPDPADAQSGLITRPPAPRWRRVGFELACAIVVGSGVALTLHLLITSRAEPARWGVEALGAAAVLLGVYGMTRWWWAGPTREVIDCITRIRAGNAPIEELSSIARGPRAIAPVVQELLRELRQQRRDLATLNEEIRQRVAQRTDALERTIGTLRHQATRDALTGLFNRRFLDTYLPQVIQRCREQHAEVAVVMADLDHFKSLNDTLGHAAGDDLLRSVGQVIRSTVRGEDVPFRVGGDEFFIAMPMSTMAHGQALGERISSLIDALGRTFKLPKRPRLSFGVACLTEVADGSAAGLMSLADKALYDCKRSRRDAQIVAPADSRAPLQAAGSSLQCPAQ